MDRRKKSYKNNAALDGIDPRALRAHRRSVDWKSSREGQHNKLRGLSTDDDIDEEIEGERQSGVGITATASPLQTTKPLDPKRAQLLEWQQKRALKRKLEGTRKAPIFKVSNHKAQDVGIYRSNNTTMRQAAPAEPLFRMSMPETKAPEAKLSKTTNNNTMKRMAPADRPFRASMPATKAPEAKMSKTVKRPPTTRSTRSVVSRPTTPPKTMRLTRNTRTTVAKPTTPKQTRTTRGRIGVQNQAPAARPTVVSRARAAAKPVPAEAPIGGRRITRSRVDTADPVVVKPANKRTKNQVVVGPNTPGVTFREPSNRLIFGYSESSDFTFRPLSPASVNKFLGGGARCSTPKDSSASAEVPIPIESAIAKAVLPKSAATEESQAIGPVMNLMNKVQHSPKPRRSVRLSIALPAITDSFKIASDVLSDDQEKSKRSEIKAPVPSAVLKIVKEVRNSPARRRSTRRSVSEPSSVLSDDQEGSKGSEVMAPVPSAMLRVVEEMRNSPARRRSTRRSVSTPSMSESAPLLPMVLEEPPAPITDASVRVSALDGTPTPQNRSAPMDNMPEDAPFRTPRSVTMSARRRTLSAILAQSQNAHRTPKALRQSFILRHLSPEEGVAVLKMSPMVELERRKPRCSTLEEPNFDDIDDHHPMTGKAPVMEQAAFTMAVKEAGAATPAATTTECSTAVVVTPEVFPSVQDQSVVHDVPYFRGLLVKHTLELNELCEKWEAIMSKKLTEEAEGEIRTAIGKAQLLISQRFKQFRGLVDDCEFKRSVRETTYEDLGGFWDMVYIQVKDIKDSFEHLEKLQANDWVSEKPKVKKRIVKKKPVSTVITNAKPRSSFTAFLKRKKQQVQKEENAPNDVPMVETVAPVEPVETVSNEPSTAVPTVLVNRSPFQSRSHTPKTGQRRSLNPSLVYSPLMRSIVERSLRHSKSPLSHPKPLPVYDQAECGLSSTSAKSQAVGVLSTLTMSTHEDSEKQEFVDTPSKCTFSNGPSLFTPDSSIRRLTRRSVAPPADNYQNVMETDAYSPTDSLKDNSFARYLRPSHREITPEEEFSGLSLASPGVDDVDMAAPMKRDLFSEFNKDENKLCTSGRKMPQQRRSFSAQKLSLSMQRNKRRSCASRRSVFAPSLASPQLYSSREKENTTAAFDLMSFSPVVMTPPRKITRSMRPAVSPSL